MVWYQLKCPKALLNLLCYPSPIFQHRVIYYLVAIPLSLSPLLSYDVSESSDVSPDGEKVVRSKSRTVAGRSDRSELIPLFCDTCPRIDCLKLIYRQIYLFKTRVNTNRVNPKLLANQKPIDIRSFEQNDVSKASFPSNKSSNHRRNGYKLFVHESH